MGGVFAALALLAYLFLLIDWSDLRSTLKLGGWASAVLFIGLAIGIAMIVSCPPALTSAAAVHH